MFALLDIQQTEKLPFWWRLFKKEGFFTQTIPELSYEKVILQYPVNANEHECYRRFNNAIKYICKKGISTIVLPNSVDELPCSYGLVASNSEALFKRLAGRMANLLLKKNEKVAIIGKRAGVEIENCIDSVVSITKSIYIYLGDDTDAYCYGLQKQTGIVAQKYIGQRVGLYIVFSATTKTIYTPESSVILNLSGKKLSVSGGKVIEYPTLIPPKRIAGVIPEDCNVNAFLAALVNDGVLASDEIELHFE